MKGVKQQTTLKEPLTSSRLNLLVVELPLILRIYRIERSHLQPARLQREPRPQLLQSRLLLVLKHVAMLSHLIVTSPHRFPQRCNLAGCGRSPRGGPRTPAPLFMTVSGKTHRDTWSPESGQNDGPDAW